MKKPGSPGLYANIHAKQERIKAGSGEKMNKVGSKAAPAKQDFIKSAKDAKAWFSRRADCQSVP